MKVKATLLEVVWYLARFLVYIKRGLFFVFSQVTKWATKVAHWYNKTIGFAVFKIVFYFQKRLFLESRRGNAPSWYKLGERWVLQFVALTIAFFFIIPQTKLHKVVFGEVPGKKTLLYTLVGPGEQDFSLSDELIQETGFNNTPVQSESWRQGAILVEPRTSVEISFDGQYNTLSNGALVKPAHILVDPINSNNVPSDASIIKARGSVVEYTIKFGDIIGKIAKEYGVSINTILLANNLTARSILRPGNTIRVPSADGVLYVVAKGDTISKIAKLYGISGKEISEFNNLNEKSLKVGKQILIPGVQKFPTKIAISRPVNNGQPAKIISKLPIKVDISPLTNTAGYIWPTGARIVTQYYGLRHTGVDIAGSLGLPNYAARDGVVIKAQGGYNGGYGNYIIIDHGNGVQTLYAHNSQLLVSTGEYVTQGQVIALLGSTGRSTGPHIHFEIRINGRRANPLQYVRR